MSSATDLPKPCTKPCNDCPWRKVSLPGWLGPMPAADWIRLASSDEPIACHTTIDADENGEGDWSNPRMRQCAGAARYRRNMGKLVRNETDASNFVEADREAIFTSPVQFMEHHGGSMDDLLAPVAVTPKKKSAPPSVVRTSPRLDDPCESCEGAETEWYCTNCGFHSCNSCIDSFSESKCPMCMVDGWDQIANEFMDDLDDDDEEW